MKRPRSCARHFASGILLALTLSLPNVVRSDIVRLKSGGQLRGQIEKSAENARQGIVVIRTLSGSKVVLKRSLVRSTERRSARVEEYESLKRSVPNTVESHWKMANWCQLQSLKNQRDFHLQRLLAIDPSHEPSHKLLGHRLRNGQWLTEDEYMQSQGYVKYRGRYITPQERDLLDRSHQDATRERDWFKNVRLWKTWLSQQRGARKPEALFELQRITDPLAVPALKKNFGKEPDVQLRYLYASILGQITGNAALKPLVELYLVEPDYEVRYLALNFIKSGDRQAALKALLPYLKDDDNSVICRTAVVLEKIGDESTVPVLIDALTTRHVFRVRVPVRTGTMTFGTDGSFGGSDVPPELQAAINAGQFPNGATIIKPEEKPVRFKIVAITKDLQNTEVLNALKRITGQNFGFEAGTWRLWWTSKKNGIN